jgi:hypothetical protein
MSYIDSSLQGYVTLCYGGFTPEQLEFMCNIYERYRVSASEMDFCFMDLVIEFNDSPADITVHVANNGIYYYDEAGEGRAANEKVTVEDVLYTGPGVRFHYRFTCILLTNNACVFSPCLPWLPLYVLSV